MEITLDIQSKASPVIRNIRFANWVWRFLKLNPLQFVKTRLLKQWDELILPVEGFYKHVAALKQKDAEDLLQSVKKVIALLDKLDNFLAFFNYGDDTEIREKYKYLLRALYRLESLAHVQATKSLPVEKTPDYIKEGLTNISKASGL